MLLPPARTSSEAHVYMDLHPCECGSTQFPRDSSVVEAGEDLASRYTGPCAGCERVREFQFALPREPAVLSADVRFGDGTPSQLLDPGEWLLVADRWASAAPQPSTGLAAPAAASARRLVAGAAAAMDEVLAFVPPDGDGVPPEAFRSELGRRVYADEPGRFYVDRLHVVRDTYREVVDEFDVLA